MKSNPYEPSRDLRRSPSVKLAKADVASRIICWSIIALGFCLIAVSLVFIVGNAFVWLTRSEPVGVQSLMLFAIFSLGAVPATIGFALQHYSRRYLRWAMRRRPA